MNSRGLDGDSLLPLILAGVRGPFVPGLLEGNDPGTGEKGVGQGGLSMVDMGDNRDVADPVALAHRLSQLA